MAMTVHCDIVSAEQKIFSGLVSMIVAAGSEGGDFIFKRTTRQLATRKTFQAGLKYVNGEGIPGNIIRGYAWWSIAKAQGEGERLIESLQENMKKDQIAQAQELETKCYQSNYKDCG